MTTPNELDEKDFWRFIKKLETSDLSDVEKLAQAFGWITGRIVEHGQHEVEIARAMQDQERLIKEQIKLGVMQHARGIFDFCHKQVTGRTAWDD
jgi:hypothetical protein